MINKVDRVSLTACAAMLISFFLPGFVSFKTSRIANGIPVSAQQCFDQYYWLLFAGVAVFIVLSIIKKDKQPLNLLTGLLAAAALGLFVFFVAQRFPYLPFELTDNSRMSFQIGFLLVVISLYSIIVICCQYLRCSWHKALIVFIACGLVIAFLITGGLDNYSVMQEFHANEAQFWGNAADHFTISFWVLIAAVVTGLPLGYLCCRHRVLDNITLVGLSITETIPTLALFAVIRIPFAWLSNTFPALREIGFGSFGVAPAATALYLYALYLVVHNVRAAFSTIDPQLLENGYAMGMTSRTVFFRVRLPQALPVIFTGIRIAFISTLVAATLASYIGAGGLGIYIVNGINSLSIDMQLLGVIPIFFMTVAADALLRLGEKVLIPHRG